MSEALENTRFRSFLLEQGAQQRDASGMAAIGFGDLMPGNEHIYVPLIIQFARDEREPYSAPGLAEAVAEARRVQIKLEERRVALRTLRARAPELARECKQQPAQPLGRTGVLGTLHHLARQLEEEGSYSAGTVVDTAAIAYNILTAPPAEIAGESAAPAA